MTLDGFTADELRALYASARARADAMHHRAAKITLSCLALAHDDAAWREQDASWHIAMAAGDEATGLMEAITDELERRADEREAARDEH